MRFRSYLWQTVVVQADQQRTLGVTEFAIICDRLKPRRAVFGRYRDRSFLKAAAEEPRLAQLAFSLFLPSSATELDVQHTVDDTAFQAITNKRRVTLQEFLFHTYYITKAGPLERFAHVFLSTPTSKPAE